IVVAAAPPVHSIFVHSRSERTSLSGASKIGAEHLMVPSMPGIATRPSASQCCFAASSMPDPDGAVHTTSPVGDGSVIERVRCPVRLRTSGESGCTGGRRRASRGAMVKLVFCLRRAAHLSRAEFQRYWRGARPPPPRRRPPPRRPPPPPPPHPPAQPPPELQRGGARRARA